MKNAIDLSSTIVIRRKKILLYLCLHQYPFLLLYSLCSYLFFKFYMTIDILRYTCTPFKKSNATPLWSIISIYGFIFIMLGIIWKLDYLSFRWYFMCHDCFAETCAGRLNWVQCQKINVAKLDHNFNRWYQFVFEIIFIVFNRYHLKAY